MEEKKITQIWFGSFLKLFSLIFLSLGVIIGLLAFVAGLLGGDVSATIGDQQLTGFKAGLVNLFLFPIMLYLTGIFFGLLAFLPFKLLLKINKGINIKTTFE